MKLELNGRTSCVDDYIFIVDFRNSSLRLYSGYNNGVKNIIHRATSTQVVHRFIQTLNDGSYGECFGFSLYRFIGVVTGFKSGKMKTLACH
jgi:hypothetical protein